MISGLDVQGRSLRIANIRRTSARACQLGVISRHCALLQNVRFTHRLHAKCCSCRSVRLASGRDAMRELKIGQYVYYVPRRAEGRYVVMRLVPRGTKGGPLYIIRSQAEPEREYTVEASELRTVSRGG